MSTETHESNVTIAWWLGAYYALDEIEDLSTLNEYPSPEPMDGVFDEIFDLLEMPADPVSAEACAILDGWKFILAYGGIPC